MISDVSFTALPTCMGCGIYESGVHHAAQVRELYQSRTAIEREYAAKLQNLSKKAAEKKAKMEARFILGEDPTRSWDVTTLKRK